MSGNQRGPITIPGSNHLYYRDAPLFILRNADMTLTTDQPFRACGSFTSYYLSHVFAKCVSGVFTTACAGAIYTAATKGGTALVSPLTSWTLLNGVGAVMAPALLEPNTQVRTQVPILSLTTGNGAALVADFFIYGFVLD